MDNGFFDESLEGPFSIQHRWEHKNTYEYKESKQKFICYLVEENRTERKKSIYFLYEEKEEYDKLTNFPQLTFPGNFRIKKFENLAYISFVGFNLSKRVTKHHKDRFAKKKL